MGVRAARGVGKHGGGGCGAVISLINDLCLMDCRGYEASRKCCWLGK